jgi:tetratricopeptide (TPR) repeat protein
MDAISDRGGTAARFFLMFQDEDNDRLAEILRLSRRQIARLRNGTSEPQKDTAERMAELLLDARQHSLSTEAERLERAEKLRAQHEARQKLTQIIEVDGLEEKDIPAWYGNVRTLLQAERWHDAMERMAERRDDPGDWERVPQRTKAYVLSDLAVCHHKTGRFVQAIEVARAAIEHRRARVPAAPSNIERISLDRFLSVVSSNLGCSCMQLGQFEEAKALFRSAIEHKRDYAAAYYNDVCAASLARDEPGTTLKLGELLAAASAFLSADDIEEVLRDATVDKDLAFARQLSIYAQVMDSLKDMIARRRSGSLRPPIDAEGGFVDDRQQNNAG